MANGPGSFNTGSGSPSLMNDLVANSSLTATASEFVPNSANQGKFSRRTRFPKGSGFKVNSRNIKSENHSKPENGDYELTTSGRCYRSSQFKSQQGQSLSFQGGNRNEDGNSSSQSNDIPVETLPSRPSAQNSKKYFNSQRKYQNRSQRDWNGQSSSGYHQDEGAVGGEDAATYNSREISSGNSKIRDRNGNKEFGSDRNSSQQSSNEKSNYRKNNEYGMSKSQKKDFYKGFERESDKQRDCPRYWERGSSKHSDRDSAFYSEDAYGSRSSDKYSSHHSDRGSELYQDKFYSNRQNRRYGDRIPERQRDDRTSYRNAGNFDQDSRCFDRGYGPRSRYQYDDYMKDDRSYRSSSSSFPRERGSPHHFNSQETFGAENRKFQSKDNYVPDRGHHDYNFRGNDRNFGVGHNMQKYSSHKGK